MPFYHFSYDIVYKPGYDETNTPISMSSLSTKFNNLLHSNADCTPTVDSTYYYCDRIIIRAKDISNKINGWFNGICTNEEKRYFMLKLDVCSINYPNYIYTINGIDQNLQLNPTDTSNEFG